MVVGSGVTTSARWERLVAALRQLRRAGAPHLRALLDRLGVIKASLLRRVPRKFHAITDEIAKFGTIGLINLGVNFAVFNALLVAVQGSEVKAKAVATVVAATCAYFLNRHWTYRHRPKTTLRREYSLFFLFNLVGLLIETAIVALAKYGFDQTSVVILNVCTFVGIGLGTVFRFWAYRTHVFKKAPAIGIADTTVLASGAPARLAEPGADVVPVADIEPGADVVVPVADTEPEADVELAAEIEPGVEIEPVARVEPAGDEDGLCDELVQLELDEMLQADDPVRR